MGDRAGKSLALWRGAASDLSEYNCARCPGLLRQKRGCFGGASDDYYADREEATDTCPRRHLKRHPDLGAAFDLYRLHGGHPSGGLAVLDQLTEQAMEALSVTDDAVGYLREQKDSEQRAELAAKAGLRRDHD